MAGLSSPWAVFRCLLQPLRLPSRSPVVVDANMMTLVTLSLLQSENVLEVAKRAKRSLADSFNTMVRRKVLIMMITMLVLMMLDAGADDDEVDYDGMPVEASRPWYEGKSNHV